jgi:hypothetical protein
MGSNGEKNNDPALNPINIAFLGSIAKETTLSFNPLWNIFVQKICEKNHYHNDSFRPNSPKVNQHLTYYHYEVILLSTTDHNNQYIKYD